MIIDYLQQNELARFARTCHGFYPIANYMLYKKAGDSSGPRIIRESIEAGIVGPMQMLLRTGHHLGVQFDSHWSFLDIQGKRLLDMWAAGKLQKEALELFHYYKDQRANRAMRTLFGSFSREYVRLYHDELEFEETKISFDNLEFLREYGDVFDAVDPRLDRNNPQQYEYTWTPLHLAAAYGNNKAVNLLLDNGADINAGSIGMCDCRELWVGRRAPAPPRFWTPLHAAICRGNLSTANLLLSRGASAYLEADWLSDYESGRIPRDPPNEVSTALHTACYLGHFHLVKTLVEGGYQFLETVTRLWERPIEYAFCGGHFRDIIPYLVKMGADINAMMVAGSWYGPMLLVACGLAKYREAMGLLRLGADVRDCEDYTSQLTPLHLCARGSHVIATKDDQAYFRRRLAGQLLEAGADVEAESRSGDTPLMVAAKARDEWFAELLVESGANVSARNDDRCSPLLLCCDSSSPHRRGDWMFECHCEIEEDRLKRPVTKLIGLFIQHGANINETDRKGDTPLLCALKMPPSNAVAVLGQIRKTVRSLVLRGADITKKGSRRLLPFQIAFFQGWVDICPLLFSPEVRERLDDLDIRKLVDFAWARYAACHRDYALLELLEELDLTLAAL